MLNLSNEIYLIVLDIDDTLYLERDYVRSGFAAVGRASLKDFGDYCWTLFERGIRGNTFDRARLAFECHKNELPPTRTLVEVYRNHFPEITLCPDAKSFLDQSLGRRLAVITDGPPVSQKSKFEALGLHKYIHPNDVIYTAEECQPKPSPEAYLKLQNQFRLNPRECIYIADNPIKDFIAPIALGWHTIRVRRPQSLHEHLDTPKDVEQEIASF